MKKKIYMLLFSLILILSVASCQEKAITKETPETSREGSFSNSCQHSVAVSPLGVYYCLDDYIYYKESGMKEAVILCNQLN